MQQKFRHDCAPSIVFTKAIAQSITFYGTIANCSIIGTTPCHHYFLCFCPKIGDRSRYSDA